MKKLCSVKTELKNCRQAFKASPKAKYAWCLHHKAIIEPLLEPAENRINYILENKLEKEQPARFRNFRPVRIKLSDELKGILDNYHNLRTDYAKILTFCMKGCSAGSYRWSKIIELLQLAEDELRRYVNQNHDELTAALFEDWPDNTWNSNYRSIF